MPDTSSVGKPSASISLTKRSFWVRLSTACLVLQVEVMVFRDPVSRSFSPRRAVFMVTVWVRLTRVQVSLSISVAVER